MRPSESSITLAFIYPSFPFTLSMVTTAEPQRPPSRTAEVQRRNRCRTALASGPTQTHGGLLRERSAMSARRVFELVAACSRALPQLICPLTTPHDSPMNRNFTERDKRSTAPAFAFANTNRSAVNRCHLTTPCRSTHPFDCLFLFPLPPFLPSLAPIARATVFLDRVRDIGRRHARMRVVLGVLSRKDTPRYAVRKVPQRDPGEITPPAARYRRRHHPDAGDAVQPGIPLLRHRCLLLGGLESVAIPDSDAARQRGGRASNAPQRRKYGPCSQHRDGRLRSPTTAGRETETEENVVGPCLLILCDSGKFVKLVGENDMEAVLQRLDRLTRKEAQTMATHTMELVCGLVKNIKVVMDGGSVIMDGVHRSLTMPVLIQQLSHDINKSRRAYNSQFNCQRRRPRLLRGWPVTGNVPALTISSGSVQKP
ncbi:hypothetical protein DFH94DRAFT_841310 [Russula ochroleuca]|uniref:Uncharacterized protein n=1 Tax=Russula ochroleuca TaxID=152965 RepID=A0A9P5N5F0_9AGAM|nr:hypothetical protein DFH94DRAFT_841310 [Russula ochroleuca]